MQTYHYGGSEHGVLSMKIAIGVPIPSSPECCGVGQTPLGGIMAAVFRLSG